MITKDSGVFLFIHLQLFLRFSLSLSMVATEEIQSSLNHAWLGVLKTEINPRKPLVCSGNRVRIVYDSYPKKIAVSRRTPPRKVQAIPLMLIMYLFSFYMVIEKISKLSSLRQIRRE
ncbi:uncharacterized protein LOC132636126 isoform X2 [Lycium barbarum]|uniref:uncharacterized protein LOC132636126 isoform X2 n=1 Tax=Lycium barbarum TaxID=112863 RepID=UPI00293E18AB|nr:uncharacterized protein LOC132636126 isoform X2 [Lycium barbarum]